MAGKRTFPEISTPRGSIVRTGSGLARLEWNQGFGETKQKQFMKAQEIIDSECLRYMNPLTPMRTGTMLKSATLGTVIGSGEIIYLAPYARRQYYNNRGGSPAHPQAKSYWFETMKNANRETILRAAGRSFT
jgi:hypothetical protein